MSSIHIPVYTYFDMPNPRETVDDMFAKERLLYVETNEMAAADSRMPSEAIVVNPLSARRPQYFR